MREIKFRGMDSKYRWFYGLLTHDKTKDKQWEWFISNSVGKPYAYGVLEHTLGQYTGLKDKNGVEIYEGDNMLVEDCDFDYKCEVSYQSGQFLAVREENKDVAYILYWASEHGVVVGNIHEGVK